MDVNEAARPIGLKLAYGRMASNGSNSAIFLTNENSKDGHTTGSYENVKNKSLN